MRHFVWAASIAALVPFSAISAQDEGSSAPKQEPEHTIEIPGIRKLKITGQYRLRYENKYNYDFDSDTANTNDFFGQRVRLNFDMVFNDDWSGFVQIQDARNWGEEMNTVDDGANGLDLHQGYVEVKGTPGIGGSSKIGRQVVAYGSQRLVGGLEWATQGRSFDGARQRWVTAKDHTLDAFAYQVQENSVTLARDDGYFFGFYGGFKPNEKVKFDAYAMMFTASGLTVNTSHNRLTLGVRYAHDLSDALDIEAEAVTQTGEQNGADIPVGETFAFHAHARYKFQGDLGAWLRADVDAASGNDPTTADNERFNGLFPTGHAHWGMIDFASWSNMVHGQVQFGTKINANTRWNVAFHHFRAMEEADSFGGPGGTISAGSTGSSKEMGNEIDLWIDRKITTENIKANLQAGYAVFLPGKGVKDNNGGMDDPAHFLYMMMNVVF